jgi:hypothetical protein
MLKPFVRRDAKGAAVLFAFVIAVCAAPAQEEPAGKLVKRYGHEFSPSLYPQKTPEEAMQSIVKALDVGRVDYLAAHLADPGFVDPRVADYKAFYKGGDAGRIVLAFERLVRETAQHFREDPALVKELRLFAKDTAWETKEDEAVGTIKGSPRRVFLKKLEDRWFLENRQR